MHLVVPSRVDEQRGARRQRGVGVLRGGRHRPVLAQEPQPGHREHEVVGQLVEGALHPEVGTEGEREDRRVGRQVAPRVVADEQDRPLLRDVPQAADLAAEPQAGEEPEARQALADVVGVALVEVGARDSQLDLLAHARDQEGDEPARRVGVGGVSVERRLLGDAGLAHEGESLVASALRPPPPGRAPRPAAARRRGRRSARAARWSARGAPPGARGRRRRARSARPRAATRRRAGRSRRG